MMALSSCDMLYDYFGEEALVNNMKYQADYYPRTDIWMTDGYGDYVRHYIRAMAAAPQPFKISVSGKLLKQVRST